MTRKISLSILILELLALIILIMFKLFSEYYLFFWQYALVAVFIFCVLISLTGYILNIFQLFLGSMFIFNIILPFGDLFLLYEYPGDFLPLSGDGIKTPLSRQSIYVSYELLSFSLIGSAIGWTLYGKETYPNVIINYKLDPKCLYLFYLTTLILIFYNFLIYIDSVSIGYIGAIHLKSYSIFDKFMILIKLLNGLFFSYLLIRTNNKNRFLFYAFLYSIPLLFLFLAGSRGTLISFFIVITALFQYRFRTINLLYFLSISFLLFFFAVFIYLTRFTEESYDYFDIFSSFSSQLVSLGSSIAVISYTFDNLEFFFNKTPFIFGYVASIFNFSPNYSFDSLANKSYLAQHLIFLLNSDKFYGGSTVGTAMVAEFLEFFGGQYYFLIFIPFAIILYISSHLISSFWNNSFKFYLLFTYLTFFFLSPRGSVFKFFSKELALFIFIFIIFNLLLYFFKKHK